MENKENNSLEEFLIIVNEETKINGIKVLASNE